MYQNIINDLDEAMRETVTFIKSANENSINRIPFKGSWTAAQTARHLVKAGADMPNLFSAQAPASNRQPDERAAELKDLLLNFEIKMESPEFIIPEDKSYTKEELINDTEKTRRETMEVLATANLGEIPELQEGNPLKDYTKLELLHFAVYHTQRHNRQIKNILEKA